MRVLRRLWRRGSRDGGIVSFDCGGGGGFHCDCLFYYAECFHGSCVYLKISGSDPIWTGNSDSLSFQCRVRLELRRYKTRRMYRDAMNLLHFPILDPLFSHLFVKSS